MKITRTESIDELAEMTDRVLAAKKAKKNTWQRLAIELHSKVERRLKPPEDETVEMSAEEWLTLVGINHTLLREAFDIPDEFVDRVNPSLIIKETE